MDIVQRARRMGDRLQEGLRRYCGHPLVGEVRGVGMMAALEIVADKATRAPFPVEVKAAQRLSDALRGRGILLRALGDALLCAPPLIIEDAELDVIIAGVGDALDEVKRDLDRLQ
jgi:4-aminobutyrate--pyruvate transaminase